MNRQNVDHNIRREEALRLDVLADSFEKAWRAGTSPRIEDFLGQLDQELRLAALKELLIVEIQLRRGRNESVQLVDYLDRFSDLESIVHDAFQRSDVTLDHDRARPSGPSKQNDETHTHHNSKTGSGRLEVRCPNCHAPTKVAVDTALTNLTCSGCGSEFSLVNEQDADNAAPLATMGRFELISRLGMGAFGAVWKARDKELDRVVAIKIPRAGAMTAEEQEKFFREARAAAQLHHPNIVTVHEVGRDGESVYIVSDFVQGMTLSDWLAGQQLTNREAAEMCVKIADALDHAHEQGVIHRDLKPANIMIDEAGQPHIMDFGLARRDVGEVTMTMEGHVLGTPAYMSPEQAQGESHKADRRSDVYSLGVILFQLLTRELPFRGNVRMVLQQVIQDEPPSPRKLNSSISKDLETITLKCLEKKPDLRFQSAVELASELRRFLTGEPIHARPVSRAEHAVRCVRRNKVVSALTSAVALALIVGTVVSAYFAIDARRREGEAKSREAETSAVLDFVENKVFAAARPDGQDGGLGRSVSLRQAINVALPFLETSFAKQPLVEARLRMTLGASFGYLGEAKTAAEQYEKARVILTHELGPDHLFTLRSMGQLARSYDDLGRHTEAVKLYEETLALMKAKLGSEHPDTLLSMHNLANSYSALGRHLEAVKLYEETLDAQKAKWGPEHPDTLVGLGNLANGYFSLGRHAEAVRLQEETLALLKAKLGPEHPDTLNVMYNLANSYDDLGRHTEAVKLLEETLAQLKVKLGPEHPVTLRNTITLAECYDAFGQDVEAVRLYEETLAITQAKLGPEHPLALETMGNLAINYNELGRDAEAIQMYEKTLTLKKAKLGPDHASTLLNMNNLAVSYKAVGRLEDAVKLYEETLEVRKTKLGPEHPNTLNSMGNLANCYFVLGRHAEAVRLLEETFALRKAKLGAEHPETLLNMYNLASSYDTLGRHEEAIKLLEETLALMKAGLGTDHPNTLLTKNVLAIVYGRAGRKDEAVQLYGNSFDGDTKDSQSLGALAWTLSTAPNDQLRDGKWALELATKACELTEHKNPVMLNTLAAASAETGDFAGAIKWAEKALKLARDGNSTEFSDNVSQALDGYKANQPLREAAPPIVHVRDETSRSAKPPIPDGAGANR